MRITIRRKPIQVEICATMPGVSSSSWEEGWHIAVDYPGGYIRLIRPRGSTNLYCYRGGGKQFHMSQLREMVQEIIDHNVPVHHIVHLYRDENCFYEAKPKDENDNIYMTW